MTKGFAPSFGPRCARPEGAGYSFVPKGCDIQVRWRYGADPAHVDAAEPAPHVPWRGDGTMATPPTVRTAPRRGSACRPPLRRP